jgi:hypothetical protein
MRTLDRGQINDLLRCAKIPELFLNSRIQTEKCDKEIEMFVALPTDAMNSASQEDDHYNYLPSATRPRTSIHLIFLAAQINAIDISAPYPGCRCH